MTVETYIQETLQSIQSIKNLILPTSIYAFSSATNAEKCFIRWTLSDEQKASSTLDINNGRVYQANVLISVFANTISNARTIADAVEEAFNNDNITSSDNILSSRCQTLSPILEDKRTVHYPIKASIFYIK